MRRYLQIWIIMGVGLVVLSGAWLAKSSGVLLSTSPASHRDFHSLLDAIKRSYQPAVGYVPDQSVHSFLRHPLDFAKSRITGGIGVILNVDPATGLPILQAIGTGSPAERAGLKPGDVIVKIDNKSTAGVALTQIVEEIRGVAAMNVTLTVQHTGSTRQLNCVIRRTSWNALGGLAYRLPPSYQSFMVAPNINGGMPVWTIIQTNFPPMMLGGQSKGVLPRSKP
jgi:membrane-associated protease RseP (regulator of RpoE activity)